MDYSEILEKIKNCELTKSYEHGTESCSGVTYESKQMAEQAFVKKFEELTVAYNAYLDFFENPDEEFPKGRFVCQRKCNGNNYLMAIIKRKDRSLNTMDDAAEFKEFISTYK